MIIDFSTCSYLFDSCAMMRKLILGVLLSFDLIYSDSCFFFQLVDVVFLGLVVESACFLFFAFVDKECGLVIIDFSTCSIYSIVAL